VIEEELQDYEDLKALRAAKAAEATEPGAPRHEIKTSLDCNSERSVRICFTEKQPCELCCWTVTCSIRAI
jgi:hypothetical protein